MMLKRYIEKKAEEKYLAERRAREIEEDKRKDRERVAELSRRLSYKSPEQLERDVINKRDRLAFIEATNPIYPLPNCALNSDEVYVKTGDSEGLAFDNTEVARRYILGEKGLPMRTIEIKDSR